MKIYAKDRIECILEKIYRFINSNKTAYHLAFGYLSNIGVEALDNLSSIGFFETFKNKFYINRGMSNIITYICILIIFIYIFLDIFLKKYFKNKTMDKRLREIYKKHTDKIFDGHETEGVSWGLGQTVMSAPNLRDGWETSQIKFEVDNNLYNFEIFKNYINLPFKNRNLNDEYKQYLEKEFFEKFTTDSDRLMLTNRPTAMTDDNALCIKLKKVKWSQLQFMWNKLLNTEVKKELINDMFIKNRISNPNSFCLHLVVKTSDSKILITKNSSNKENDYAMSWAVSIGEQIDKTDVKNIDDDCAYNWVKRALNEELCIKEEEFDKKGIHFLSINLEGDIVNFAFVCIVEIFLDSENLRDRLYTESRMDNEFKELDFIEIDDIPSELINETRKYHPSSKIRMIYTYLNSKGSYELKCQLLKNEYGNE